MIAAAEAASEHPALLNGKAQPQRLALSPPWPVKNYLEPGANEDGWHAIAVEFGADGDGSVKFVVVKGSDEAVVDHSKVGFAARGWQP